MREYEKSLMKIYEDEREETAWTPGKWYLIFGFVLMAVWFCIITGIIFVIMNLG